MSNPLRTGVQEFRKSVYPKKKALFEKFAEGQQPHSVFVTCSDSRIDPYLLTSSEPGDIFVIRTAGNVVPPKGCPASGVSATIEYAISVLKVGEIVVCGHARCGAMDAVTRPETMENLGEVRAWLDHVGTLGAEVNEEGPFPSDEVRLETAAKRNVNRQLENLETFDFIQEAMDEGRLRLTGWYYDFVSGQVEEYDAAADRYVAV
ncbi:MAG: hypothetical protein MI923_28810 [Phycisphaerales bacterium]|nr:hypothetical protein [Phycisphaerales bacterium]